MHEITADSVPVYDKPFNPGWSVIEWMQWYDKLITKFSIADAQRKWAAAWDEGDDWYYSGVPEDARTWDENFKNFLKDKPALYAIVYDGFTGEIAEFLAGGVSIFGSIGETVGQTVDNLGGTVKNTTATLKWLLPVALVLAVGIAGFVAYNYASGTIKKAA